MTDPALENKFADYDSSSGVVLPDGKVRQHFGTAETAETIAAALFQFTHEFVKKHVLELAGELEKNLDKHTDWNDSSVYEGTTGVRKVYYRKFWGCLANLGVWRCPAYLEKKRNSG
ncbi:hypothetical protein HPB47_022441 [Ixodes persulcatus]|uniref:Uncharacterized protein n=1 Tax=Ixodes persulcatus TaxID=34615 RepID=A0AC60Q9Q0_IXOPE|nr:hypothetical protein HPB47_022441 [Ixodes persulcatus]